MSALDYLPLWLRALLHPPHQGTTPAPEPDQDMLRLLQQRQDEVSAAREAVRRATLHYRHFE